jgi:hypothetical protein
MEKSKVIFPYFKLKRFHEEGYPEHSTVCISLWGLQYRFPEHDFSNDMVLAIERLIEADEELDNYRELNHGQLPENKNQLADLFRKSESSKRQAMHLLIEYREAWSKIVC